jgi:putative DNA primase/helicase
MQREPIWQRAVGRWASILPAIGVPKALLTRRNMPCPWCAGRDRFRFTDLNGNGGFFCSKCGSGTGVDLVMRYFNLPFAEAAKKIEAELPSAVIAKPARRDDMGALAARIWNSSSRLTGSDPASLYLASRGLEFGSYPSQLRYQPAASYVHEDKSRSTHPALIANFCAPDISSTTIHMTYLDEDGAKAKVSTVKKVIPGKIPVGGSVRLAPSADTMGIAEGIETALSAAQLYGVPVWSALTSGGMIKWTPPATVRHIIVFGDNDLSFTGQAAAYALAYRLQTDGLTVEVRLPDHVDTDWNDVLMADLADLAERKPPW